MKHAARIFLLISATLLLAYYLPIAWHIVTAARDRGPFVQYSDTGHGFLFTRYDINPTTRDVVIHYTDAAGRAYERDDFEQMLPLTYYMQLEKNGTMPKEINGTPVTPAAIRREMFSLRVRPDELDVPSIPLHTVFETASGRARLEMPPDYMRIRDHGRIEFLNPKTNQILQEKSTRYTTAFASAKFVFPVTAIGSNPNPRKPYDEGIYIADSANQLFRLRQVKGAPELIRISEHAAEPAAWRALHPRHIIVNEIETREIRALIIDTDGHPWLVTGKNYTLHKLPVSTYTPAGSSLTIRGNLLNRLILVQNAGKLEAVALDRDYNVIDRYEETLPNRDQQPSAKIAAVLFPFTWWLNDDSSSYYNFYGKLGSAWVFALNAVFLIVYIIILRARRSKVAQTAKSASSPKQQTSRLGSLRYAPIPELAAIALCGLCAFIPALLLPRAD